MKHYYVRHGRRVNGNNTAATAALHCLSVCLHPPPTLAWRGKREGERRLERRGKDGRWNWCAASESASLPNKAAEKEGETNALSAASLKRRHIGGVALLPPSRSPMPPRRHSDRKTVGGMGSLPMIERLESERYQVSGGGSINLTRIRSPCLNNCFGRAGRERREGPEGR